MRHAAIIALFISLAGLTARGADVPVVTPDAESLSLDEIGLYEVGYALRHKPEVQFPIGWSGSMEAHTGVSCEAVADQAGKHAFFMHSPWRNAVGMAFQQFTFDFPPEQAASTITLRGATAMQERTAEKSDGVTFRVFVNGTKLLEEHRTDTKWKEFEFDLTAYAGKRTVLRFEVDPGPHDDPSFDYSLWGNRTLIFKGLHPPAPAAPTAPPAVDLTHLYSAPNGSVAPRNAFAGTLSQQLTENVGHLKYSGPDGSLEYHWTPPQKNGDAPLGSWVLHASAGKDGAQRLVPLATDATLDWSGDAVWQSSRWEREAPDTGALTLVSEYKIGEQKATLRLSARLNSKALTLDVKCDVPAITKLNMGSWGPVLRRRKIAVPYFDRPVEFLQSENLFVSRWLDWTTSSASSQDASSATYDALTDGSRRAVSERLVYAVAWNFDEVLPNLPNTPSPELATVGKRVIVDSWGGGYAEVQKNLARLRAAGLTDCFVLVHDWQHSGYDNGLPTHLPANEKYGGDAGMKALTAAAREMGYRIGLHENYVDYYTNCEKFDENDIALESSGKKMNAWYNEGTKMQSYAVRPSAMLRLAKTQSPQVHERFGTSASFLDVNSSVPPWFHVDHRAGDNDAGLFSTTWNVHRSVWSFERETHGGPIFGEGGRHWYWSGCLDGVEAELSAGWGNGRGLTAPLCVDFDLLKIHPLQCNHGMGYFERWAPGENGELISVPYLDQYRMQEAIFGHAGYIGARSYTSLPLAWLEHHLMQPVANSYATAKPVKIEYRVGDAWTDTNAAARANEWNCARVTYDNGLSVTANSSAAELKSGDWTLPQFGWKAEGAGISVYSGMRGGQYCDFAQTATSLFANARNAADWNLINETLLFPRVTDFTAGDDGKVNFSYHWRVDETQSANLNCFVHIVADAGDKKGQIVMQQDHVLNRPLSQWKAGDDSADGPFSMNVAALPDGDYEWYIGLFSLENGARVRLPGADGGNRVSLGKLRVHAGAKPQFIPAPEPVAAKGVTRLNSPAKIIDFGPLRTDGSALYKEDGNTRRVWVMPAERIFALEFNTARVPAPALVRCTGGTTPTVVPEVNGIYWRLPLNGASVYEWDAK